MSMAPEQFESIATAEQVDALAERPRSVRREAWDRLKRNKLALVALAILALYVLLAGVAFTGVLNEPIERTVGGSYDAPALRDAKGALSPAIWLGTDFLGRSVFYRLLYGARVALTVSILASLISIAIGTTLGLIAGYFGGWIDDLITWLFSTVSSIPGILLLISLAFVLKGYEIDFWKNELLGSQVDINY